MDFSEKLGGPGSCMGHFDFWPAYLVGQSGVGSGLDAGGRSFLAASTQLYRSMARRRWIYGPLSVVGYLGIHCIATSAMVAVALRYVRNGLLSYALIP